MAKKNQRKLIDITLDEAKSVLKICNPCLSLKGNRYRLKADNNGIASRILLYHRGLIDLIFDKEKGVIFGESVIGEEELKDKVITNNNYLRFYRTIKYLEKKGFDLKNISKKSDW